MQKPYDKLPLMGCEWPDEYKPITALQISGGQR